MKNFFRAGQRAALMFVTVLMSVSFTAVTQAADPFWKESTDNTAYPITVYRSTTCGCCKDWVDHLKDHNFKVKEITDSEMNTVKKAFGVPQNLASCHTASINGKIVEGHVPAQDIKRMLETDNDIRLLTVPGMASGTPGMDMDGAEKHDFRVYAVKTNGDQSVFNTYTDY
ncbi:DUF411 domain-containing protein [Aliamphritea hakodatensis]|uniref:DUF411 domain-containing protein n=1 Tax=Aliamphritea hakodatensis TaxID=2895352 RepID=UPI0022FD9D04|nr:DUF411 domain-containing protein [Aliamphritea hakodatensis]